MIGYYYSERRERFKPLPGWPRTAPLVEKTVKSPLKLKWHVLATALVTFVVYLVSLKNGFLEWDDGTYVADNPHIRQIGADFFHWALFEFHGANWHPLTWFSHALDYSAWGLNPAGHHLTSVILHALVTALVTVLAARLIFAGQQWGDGSRDETLCLRGAALTGLLFGLHPLHVESVAWVAERKDLLCALFYLLAIIAWLRHAAAAGSADTPAASPLRSRGYLAALCLFLLALASKPMAVSLPLVLLILDWYPLGRFAPGRRPSAILLEKVPFILLSGASSVITFMAQKSGEAVATLTSLPIPARLVTALTATIGYLGKMLFPVDLIPFYPYPRHISLFTPVGVTALVAVAAITVWCIRTRTKERFWLAAWGYYLVTLLPVIGIVQIGRQSMADRYTYLPSIAPFLLAGVLIAAVLRRAEKSPTAGVLARGVVLLLMGGMAFATVRQIGVWRDGITLWTRVIDRYSGEENELLGFSIAFNNRGIALHGSGKREAALVDFSRAIELAPDDSYYLNRGTVFLKGKEYDRALADYREAIRLNPANSSASYNIACIHSLGGRTEEACHWLRESIARGKVDFDYIRNDTDLDNIRNAACYREIMAGR